MSREEGGWVIGQRTRWGELGWVWQTSCRTFPDSMSWDLGLSSTPVVGGKSKGGEHKSPAVVVDEFLAVMTMFRGWKPIRVPCWARWMLAGGWCGVGLIAFSHICEERKYGRTFHIWPAWLGASACFTCGRPYKLFWCFYLSAAAYGPLTSLHSRVVDSCQATTLPSTQTPRIFFLLFLLPDSLFKAFNL